jgi:hypothetical protein
LRQLERVIGPEFVEVPYPAVEILSRNGIAEWTISNIEEKTARS